MRNPASVSRASAKSAKFFSAAVAAVVLGTVLSAGCSHGPSSQALATYDAKPTAQAMPPNMTKAQTIQWIQNDKNASDREKQMAIAQLQGTAPPPAAASAPPVSSTTPAPK